jgi:hypothetical protein
MRTRQALDTLCIEQLVYLPTRTTIRISHENLAIKISIAGYHLAQFIGYRLWAIVQGSIQALYVYMTPTIHSLQRLYLVR